MSTKSFHLQIIAARNELSWPVRCVDHDGVEEAEDIEKVEEGLLLGDGAAVALAQFSDTIA